MRLSLASGPLPRLLAPGVPDWIGADGTRVGWLLRDRLFLRDADGVRVVELPEYAEDAVVGPTGWHVALGNGVVHVDADAGHVASLLVDDDADPVAVRPGADVILFVEVPEHRLLRASDGRPLPLPDAALRAKHIRPWASGIGACWVDFDTLYRLGARISALGKAPGPEGIACGPEGAVLVALKSDTVVAAPRGLAARVGRRLDADSARFSADGKQVLAADDRGVVRVDLATGKVEQSWSGSYAPVGFAPGPVLWDVDAGTLVDADGTVLLDGFAGSSPDARGSVIAGPGGGAWRIGVTTERFVDGLAGGACATDGARVVHVDDAHAHVVGADTRFAHDLPTEDDPVASARIDSDTLVVRTLDGEIGRYALADGASRGRSRDDRGPAAARVSAEGVRLPAEDGASVTQVGGARIPLPADGALRVEGRVCLWSDEGLLVEIEG